VGHDWGVQTHLPCVLHSCVIWHAAQVPPPTPQWSLLESTQVPLEQQPAHVVPPQLHAPFEHACPVAHLPHALPPEPHVSVL
jgi:hypothetical protein